MQTHAFLSSYAGKEKLRTAGGKKNRMKGDSIESCHAVDGADLGYTVNIFSYS